MFQRVDCEAKDWVSQTLSPLPGGDKTLEGRQLVVSYALADGAQPMTGLAVQRNFVTALKAIGATTSRRRTTRISVAASRTTPAGETWYIYMAGGGNSDARSSYALTTFVIAPFVQEVQARAMTDKLSTNAPCGDPPWLARGLAEFKLGQCDVRDRDMVDLNNLPDGNKHLEGMRVSVDYAVADPARVPPGMMVQRNFRAALGAIGATLVSAPDDEERVVATQATPAGETWYIYTAGGGNSDARTSFRLTTLVVGPFVQECRRKRWPTAFKRRGRIARTRLGSCANSQAFG